MEQTFHLVRFGGFSYLDVNSMPAIERRMLYKALVEDLKKEAEAGKGNINSRTLTRHGLHTNR